MKQAKIAPRVNLSVRLKNPWFWVGLMGVILSAAGADPAMFTSWQLVWQAIRQMFTNPYQLAAVLLAVLGVFVDPTTEGICDSEQALRYSRPKAKEEEK